MLAQPRLVEVVAVEVGDVEVVGALDPGAQVGVELVVAGEEEPRTEERRHEPRVAHDRAAAVSMRIPAWPSDVARIVRLTLSLAARPGPVGRAQATGGSVYCWPARDTCSVHAEPSQ